MSKEFQIIPMAIETLGPVSEEATCFLEARGTRLSYRSSDQRLMICHLFGSGFNCLWGAVDCGVVRGSRFRIHRWAPHIFTWCISLQQAEITGEVLTRRFSSSTAVFHSASYPPGRVNRVAASLPVVGSAAGLTQQSRKSFAFIHVVAFRSAI